MMPRHPSRLSPRRLLLAGVPTALVLAALALAWPQPLPAGPLVASVPVASASLGTLVLDPSDSHVFVAGYGTAQLTVLDATTGALLPSVALPTRPYALAVAPRQGRVFAAAGTTLWMLDAHTTQLLRVAPLSPNPSNNALHLLLDEARGRLYVATSGALSCTPTRCTPGDGAVDVFDARTGRPLRTLTLPRQGSMALALDPATHLLLLSGADPTPGRGHLTVLDPATGRLVRRLALALTPAPWSPPLVDHTTGCLVVAGDPFAWPGPPRLALALLALPRGRPLRTLLLAGGASEAPATFDGRTGALYVPDRGPLRAVTTRTTGGSTTLFLPRGPGRLLVLNARTGATRRTLPLPGTPLALVLDAPHGHLLVLLEGRLDAQGRPTTSGTLAVLDARSGLLRSVPVPVGAFALALDPRSGHLVIESAGGGTPVSDPWPWVPPWARRHLPLPPPPPGASGTLTILDTARL